MRGHDLRADLAPDRHAVDPEQIARPVIRLDQRADGVARAGLGHHARGGARAALELVADHAGAAADIAFGDRLAAVAPSRAANAQFLGDREALNVVQPAIIGLGHDRQMEGCEAPSRTASAQMASRTMPT